MKHRIYHSSNMREHLSEYAPRLDASSEALTEAYEWMLAHNVLFEEPDIKEGNLRLYVAFVNIESRIEQPLARKFYALLRDEVPAAFTPLYGINWPTFKDRWLRAWEQCYNILINKIPSHNVRIWWLRLGGAKIGKGSSVWRNTEIVGIENLRIGDDSVVGWHCLLDGRAGLIIGSHVTVASYVLIIAGGHDMQSEEFEAFGQPIYIEDYAWIASRAMIISGAHVSRGVVVTAGTVVNKELAPYKIVGGIGAKPMGERPHNLAYKVGGKGLFTLFH